MAAENSTFASGNTAGASARRYLLDEVGLSGLQRVECGGGSVHHGSDADSGEDEFLGYTLLHQNLLMRADALAAAIDG